MTYFKEVNMPTTEPKQLLNIKDVSTALNISTATIWRLIKAGTIPAPIKIGGSTRWRRSDIEAIFASPEAE